MITVAGPPTLSASLRGRPLRRLVLAHGVALRVRTTGSAVSIRGWLRRRGHDLVVLDTRLAWTSGATRAVRIPLTASGRRLLQRSAHPRLTLRLTASGPGGTARPVRLSLRLR